jgi:hypothetical protein
MGIMIFWGEPAGSGARREAFQMAFRSADAPVIRT